MKKLVQLRDHYLVVWRTLHIRFKSFLKSNAKYSKASRYTASSCTDLAAARTLQLHVFKLGPKNFEMNEFMY